MGPTLRTAVVYPGVMPAVIEVARAFFETGMLSRFETTFVYHEDDRLAQLLRSFGNSELCRRMDTQLSRRALGGIPKHLVSARPRWELLRIAASRLSASELLMDRLWEQTVLRFDRDVSRDLCRDVEVVYGYEHACRASFMRARNAGIRTVFDMASPHYALMDSLLASELAQFPALANDSPSGEGLVARRNQHKQAELDLADLVIANSQFTARSLIESGYPAARVRVVPLGAPPLDQGWRELPQTNTVRFLFAGSSVGVRKGAHHLLEAWQLLDCGRVAELALAGRWTLPLAMRRDLPRNAIALGSITQAELFRRYRESSVLVLPSLCDGFGMVVTEALAHGLPVIATKSVGASELIEEGVNGFVLSQGDVDGLAARLQWCIEHPAELCAMREAAHATAARHQWSAYRRRLVQTVREFFGEGARN